MTQKTQVAKILIQNDEDKFLMLKKSREYAEHYGGRWEQPGGKIENSENRFDAIKREVREETGLEIEDLEDVVRIEIEDEDCVNCFILATDDTSGDIELSEEHSDYKWFSIDELRKADWHKDAGYGIPPAIFLEYYLGLDTNY